MLRDVSRVIGARPEAQENTPDPVVGERVGRSGIEPLGGGAGSQKGGFIPRRGKRLGRFTRGAERGARFSLDVKLYDFVWTLRKKENCTLRSGAQIDER
jgi:hypothetical protein